MDGARGIHQVQLSSLQTYPVGGTLPAPAQSFPCPASAPAGSWGDGGNGETGQCTASKPRLQPHSFVFPISFSPSLPSSPSHLALLPLPLCLSPPHPPTNPRPAVSSCSVSEGFLSRHPRALLVNMALAGADSSILACLCLLHQLAVRQHVSAWAEGVLSSSSMSQPRSLCSAPGLPELTAFLGQPQLLSGSIRGRWCCPGRIQRLGSCAR